LKVFLFCFFVRGVVGYATTKKEQKKARTG
jgi:hypothetical protein